MCGIAGAWVQEATPDAARAVVDAMVGALGHRGPDGRGAWVTPTPGGGAIALGHTRLSIIDLSEAGRQPMTRGPLTATYNGEIYNYRELRDDLGATRTPWTSDSDTEVLLAAFARWGDQALDRLDGMFAYGIWDDENKRLRLGRDRLGVKPLYFHRGPRHFVFASEIRALLASGLVPRRLDRASLWHYLGYQSAPTPATLVEGVRLLGPGHVMDVDATGDVRTRRYWTLLGSAPADLPASVERASADVSRLLRESVSLHLVSDVPVGVFLSGGIDSGAVVSLLHTLGRRPATFTVALDDDAEADESGDARLLAETFRTDHADIRVRGRDVLDMLPEVLGAIDHPSGDGVNTYVVARAVSRQGLKVALSGLGGDELFGGYASFRRLTNALPAARRLAKSPAALRATAARLLRGAGAGRVATNTAAALLESDGTLAQAWPLTRELFGAADRHRLLAGRLTGEPPNAYESLVRESLDEFPEAGLWAQISAAEARGYMHDVLLRDTDQMSMAHGLEVRVPLLDHRLASYVAALPDEMKSNGSTTKPLLVRSLSEPLPAAITDRPKRGFVLPFDTWMRGPLKDFCQAQLGEGGLDGRAILAPGAASGLWSTFLRRGHGVTWGRVWALVALNAWMERTGL
jgi:asparagine synthase (glutamine-hydrolysing)